MLTFRNLLVVPITLLGALLTPRAPAQSTSARPHFDQLAEPPVPSDPLELVPGDAQPVTDAAQRAQIIDMLEKAHANSNVRAQPYDLKTTFTVSGSLSAGEWTMEDTAAGKGHYRWTIQGAGFSEVNMNINRLFYSSQPAGTLPLRVIQVREAVFSSPPLIGPYATLRTANATLNGVNLVCALIEHMAGVVATAGPRRWEEQEYCVDPNAGTLATFSEVAGVYVHYDYSRGLQFHGKLIWNGFTITQAGQTIIQAQTESITDPVNDPAAFQTAGLNQIGAGGIMSMSPSRARLMQPLPAGAQSAAMQVVELHALISPTGGVSDAEVLASSDPSLNQSALEFAANWQPFIGPESQNGATPQSHELIFTFQYFNAPSAQSTQQ